MTTKVKAKPSLKCTKPSLKCTKQKHCARLLHALEDGQAAPRRGLDTSLIMNLKTGVSYECIINRRRGGSVLIVAFCPFCGVALR
jgi:hypothetical protein